MRFWIAYIKAQKLGLLVGFAFGVGFTLVVLYFGVISPPRDTCCQSMQSDIDTMKMQMQQLLAEPAELPELPDAPVPPKADDIRRVHKQWTNIREQPSPKSGILDTLAIGQRVRVVDQRGEWLKLERGGWIHSRLVEEVSE